MLNKMVRFIRDFRHSFVDRLGRTHEITLEAGLVGIVESIENDKYTIDVIGSMVPKPTCTLEDIEQIEYEEVVGVVEDIDDDGHYAVGGWCLGNYEGKKVRLRVELVD